MSLLELFDRTFKNCEFYEQEHDNDALLNEIGVLRGIMYCIESVMGEENARSVVGWSRSVKFDTMIRMQVRLREKGEQK